MQARRPASRRKPRSRSGPAATMSSSHQPPQGASPNTTQGEVTRSWRKSASPVLVGLVLSVAVAAILALVTSTTVLLGFVAGLVGTAIALLYDLIRRFEERRAVEDQRSVLLAAV